MRHLQTLLVLALLLALAPPVTAQLLLQNDGWFDGQVAVFQGGFTAGEEGAVRLSPPGPVPMRLTEVRLLFGGDTSQQVVTLRIYDDSAGTVGPGAIIFSADYQLTGSDAAMSVIDLSAENVMVSDDFRVSILFQHAGTPSIARDDDGTISSSRNFINATGLGWIQSSLLGLTGDWVIRAVVESGGTAYTVGGTVSGLNGTMILQNNGGDDLLITSDGPYTFSTPISDGSAYNVTIASAPSTQDCVIVNASGIVSGSDVTDVDITCTDKDPLPEELKLDGFGLGGTAAFQGGFVANEIAAVRLTPSGPSDLQSIRFLWGGAPGVGTVRLHIWEDPDGMLAPGTELFAQDYGLTAADNAFQEIDLLGEGLQVTDAFRVGIELLNSGLPSVARDDDGTIDAANNFVFISPGVWALSQSVGITGDWVIRAVVISDQAAPEPLIMSIVDVGNDQGKQVRIQFQRSTQDALGAGTPVLQYEAFRRIDPLPAGAAPQTFPETPSLSKRLAGWEFVGAVPAHGEDTYNLIAATLADSTIVDGMYWSTFLIRAATALPLVFFDSPPDSGYSIDNLAPGVPQQFILAGSELQWDPALDPDFSYWTVYGSDTSASFDASATMLGRTIATSFDVSTSPHAYFFLTAVDFSGNEGDAAVTTGNLTATNTTPDRIFTVSVVPNPFNPATTLRFRLPADDDVSASIYDARGRQVESLFENRRMTAGDHSIPYRSQLPSGMYFLRVRTAGEERTVKLCLIR